MSMMRRVLDALYRVSGAIAGTFLVAISVVILLQVGANIIDLILERTIGSPIGLLIPSYAEFAGFFLSSSTFFALAYTLRAGGHIRVTLIIQRISSPARRWIEAWCYGFTAFIAGFFAYSAVLQVMESAAFEDMVPGIVKIPLWIPQTSMAIGLIILTIALMDTFIGILMGDPLPEPDAETQLSLET